MGLFDNVDQYFSSPDVSSGYSGMDSGGGSYWDTTGGDFNYDVASSGGDSGSDSFWNEVPDAWDTSYDDIFSSDALMPDNYQTSLFDPQPEDASIGSKALGFLGSKGGLSLLGGALAGGMKMYGQKKHDNVLSKSKEEERKFQKELLAQKEAHDKEMLAMRLAAQDRGGGGGSDRPAPGTAEKTTTALGAHKVRW